MVMTIKKQTLLLLAVSIFAFPLAGMAQVATAPLDPTQPVINAAAAGWKKDMVLFGSYFTGSGKRSVEGQDVYEFTRSGNTAGMTAPWGPVVMEASALNWTQQTALEKRYVGALPIALNSTQAHVAVNHEDWASVGVSSLITKKENYLDTDRADDITTENAIGGSLALSFMGNYFIGLGSNNVKSTGDAVVENRWTEKQTAVGVRFGMPGGFQFRAEMAGIKSPRTEEQALGDLYSNVHYEESTKLNQVEISINGLIFAYKHEKKEVLADATDNGAAPSAAGGVTVTTEVSENGVLWIPQNGLVLGFYFVTETTTEDFEDSHSIFKVQTGYIF